VTEIEVVLETASWKWIGRESSWVWIPTAEEDETSYERLRLRRFRRLERSMSWKIRGAAIEETAWWAEKNAADEKRRKKGEWVWLSSIWRRGQSPSRHLESWKPDHAKK
jgi:hypothetical protein